MSEPEKRKPGRPKGSTKKLTPEQAKARMREARIGSRKLANQELEKGKQDYKAIIRARHITVAKPLGDPPDSLNEREKQIWNQFKSEIHWLEESDRALMFEMCRIRARSLSLEPNEFMAPALLNTYIRMLGEIGCTPVGRAKIVIDAEQAELRRRESERQAKEEHEKAREAERQRQQAPGSGTESSFDFFNGANPSSKH